ncbi:transposase [bacterium]|nr:transposase [bacterium]RQV96362.1 MAG: transposase [bacterium]
MPRRSIPLLNNHYYHIFNRVIQGRKLFHSNDDYIHYLTLFKEIDFSLCCRLIAYCLMPNHYHYLVHIVDPKLFSKKMMFFFNKYLKSLNTSRHESGRYFVNRFKAKVIEKEQYLLKLCCYIHLNPLKAGLVQSLEDWPFSNYLDFIGRRNLELWDKRFFEKFIGSHSNYHGFIHSLWDKSELEPYIFDDD